MFPQHEVRVLIFQILFLHVNLVGSLTGGILKTRDALKQLHIIYCQLRLTRSLSIVN